MVELILCKKNKKVFEVVVRDYKMVKYILIAHTKNEKVVKLQKSAKG